MSPLLHRLRRHGVAGFVAGASLALLWLALTHLERFTEREPGYSFDELMTAMAGVLTSIVVTTFSAVFVALQLASAQYSPRVVRGFFREDWRVQFVLAAFVLDISYLLTLKLLGLVHVEDSFTVLGRHIPHPILAITLGILLILLVFPYFVYYIIRNINAAKVTQSIATRTIREIRAHYKATWSWRSERAAEPVIARAQWLPIHATERGYLDSVHPLALRVLRLLGHQVELTKFVGSFISKGTVVAYVDYRGKSRTYRAMLNGILRLGLSVHEYRSYTQDIHFGIRQLVDIAIKAISPAINDPTTAVSCINYLGEVVKEYARFSTPSSPSKALARQGIHIREFDFDHVVDHAFNQIHFWGKADVIIVRHLVHTLTEVLATTQNPENLVVLIREVEDMELLEKSDAEMLAVLGFREHVRSLRDHYLRRFVKTALARIETTFAEVAALAPELQAEVQTSYALEFQQLREMEARLRSHS